MSTDKNEALRVARKVVAVLGPNVPKSVTDTGARWEWQHALELSRSLVASLSAPAAGAQGEAVGSRRAEVLKEAMHSWHDTARVEHERAESLAATLANDTAYARRLAVALHRDHYAAVAPQWEALDDLNGILSQIDNMICGLTTPAPSHGTAGEAEELARCKSSRERWIAMSCEFEHRLETLRSSLWSIVEHWKRRADESEYGPAYASCADEIKAELIDDAATPPSASTSAEAGAVDDAMVERAMNADAEEYGASIPASRVRRLLTAALTANGEVRGDE